MSGVRTQFGFKRTVCACVDCSNFCRHMPGLLIPADLVAISKHLGYEDPVVFAIENLSASGGATLSNGKDQIQIPTLVPQRRPDGACKFLTASGACAIHTHSPFGCSFFDSHQEPTEANTRSLRGHMAIKQEWDTGGLYAQLWLLLYSIGLRAPSAREARARMRRETE